jgi:hypothetical protein
MILQFSQIGGALKTLELADHAAPHGRSHVAAVAHDKLTLRESEVYVAGGDSPVRHLHGLKHGDWELTGRFSDYWGGNGFALTKSAEVKAFVAEQQPVRISWGDSLLALGLITEYDPGREDEHEIEWKLTVKIDKDLTADVIRQVPQQRRPRDYTNVVLAYLNQMQTAVTSFPPLRRGIFDSINSLIASIATITSTAVSIANELQSFENNVIGSLRRFRTTMHQLKTAVIIARDTIDSFTVDLAIEEQNANAELTFYRSQSTISDTSLSIIKEAAAADRRARIAEQGTIKTIVEAKGGDTFELYARKYYGSANRASDIRDANGASTAQPVVGQLYIIPI